jgi:outer membrane immunogenic protein
MKRLLLAGATIASLIATNAFAADLPAKVYTKAPPPVVAVYNWTGFYVGGNVGYSWGRSRDDSTLANTAGTVLFANSSSVNLDGIVGGGQIGYN